MPFLTWVRNDILHLLETFHFLGQFLVRDQKWPLGATPYSSITLHTCMFWWKREGRGIWVKRFEQFAGAASYVGGVTGVAPLVVRCRQFMSLPNSLLGLPSFVDRHTCNMSLSLSLFLLSLTCPASRQSSIQSPRPPWNWFEAVQMGIARSSGWMKGQREHFIVLQCDHGVISAIVLIAATIDFRVQATKDKG